MSDDTQFSQEEVIDTLNDLLLKERRRICEIIEDEDFSCIQEKIELEGRLKLLNACFGHVGGC